MTFRLKVAFSSCLLRVAGNQGLTPGEAWNYWFEFII